MTLFDERMEWRYLVVDGGGEAIIGAFERFDLAVQCAARVGARCMVYEGRMLVPCENVAPREMVEPDGVSALAGKILGLVELEQSGVTMSDVARRIRSRKYDASMRWAAVEALEARGLVEVYQEGRSTALRVPEEKKE